MGAPSIPAPTRVTLALALLLTGLSMRTAVTSVGAALDDLQDDLGATGGTSGLITTVPVICFAVFGALTPRAARRVGTHRLLVLALTASALGLAARPFGGTPAAFVALSVPALAGVAVTNVLMPGLVKRHFPDRIGAMTALYTTALAVGATAAAGLTVPIGDLTGGYRDGLAAWALVAAVAVVPWLPSVGRDRRSVDVARPRGVPNSALLRSPTAWAIAVFFGTQSMQAYITFGWFPRFLTAHGVSSSTAGVMLAVLSAISIPVSFVVPRIPAARHRATIGVFSTCLVAAYVLMAVAPAGAAWVWMILAGIGAGTFPLALTLLATRARTPETSAALSAFAQAIGYVIAGTGPLLFGALYGLTDSWALPIAVLFVALAVMSVAAVPATRARFVDDELAASSR